MNLTFTAHWKKNLYNISYDLNNGINSIAPTYYDKETDSIILGSPERKGYTFTGWTGSNGDKKELNVKIKGDTSNLKYVAHWDLNTYDVYYDMNDDNYSRGTNNSDNKSKYNVETADFQIKDPSRRGYTFEGLFGQK